MHLLNTVLVCTILNKNKQWGSYKGIKNQNLPCKGMSNKHTLHMRMHTSHIPHIYVIAYTCTHPHIPHTYVHLAITSV